MIFPEGDANPYKVDLAPLESHILDTGHFTLEEHGEEIAAEMRDFQDSVHW